MKIEKAQCSTHASPAKMRIDKRCQQRRSRWLLQVGNRSFLIWQTVHRGQRDAPVVDYLCPRLANSRQPIGCLGRSRSPPPKARQPALQARGWRPMGAGEKTLRGDSEQFDILLV